MIDDTTYQEVYYNSVKELFNADFAAEFFDTEKINKMLDNHHNGTEKNGKKIYVIFSFLIWYKRFFVDEV